MIRTDRLRLVPGEIRHFEATRQGDTSLGALLGVQVTPGWEGEPEHRDAIASSDDLLREDPAAAGWWTYFFVHEADAALIGVGGLKGRPRGGVAELGYAVAPGYRGRGLALEAARGLLDYALASPEVRTVQAHTLPETNASTRLLEKLGMRRAEILIDPDDGEIWRWELSSVRP